MSNIHALKNVSKSTNIKPLAFSIQSYIPSLILPKCVIVHGEILSSVYFQIALNINHQNNSFHWKKNGCWMKTKTISKNIGYNCRTINYTIGILESLELIKIKQQGKLKVITLFNHDFKNMQQIENFNKKLESKLLVNANNTQSLKFITLFRQLEDTINFNDNFCINNMSKSIWFPNINLLRLWLIEIEQIYKGSSLFFFNNIISQSPNNKLLSLSESDRAIMNGSSQTTVSRYINSYIKNDVLKIETGNVNTPTMLSFNSNLLNSKNILKSVVNNDMTDNELICPICQRTFSENRSLSVHISKTKDAKHILLNKLKKENINNNNIQTIYLDHKEAFDKLENTTAKIQPTNNYLNIPCDCKMTCSECYKNWKTDFYNDCKHARKDAFIEEFKISKKSVKKTEENKNINNKDIPNTIISEDFNIVKPTKKPVGEDTAPGLVKYFYSLTNGSSPNFGKECAQVKNLIKKCFSPSDIRLTMDYLKRKGSIDLRFLNNSINDALLEKQYMEDTNKDGTESFLVKMYYDGLGVPLNVQTLIKDVMKIKETMNTGLSYEQTKLVIQYMIDIKCPTLNFIGSKRTEALTKATKQTLARNNPSFFDRSDLDVIKNELINGRTSLKKISENFKPEAKKMAQLIFKKNEFSNKFTHFEWAWKVGLELDEEMYRIASSSQKTNEFILDKILNDPNITQSQKQTVLKLKEKFNSWLGEQTEKFQTSKIN